MKGYNTNLASEFHVMSILFRLGLSPGLTLGNKKSVDIQIIDEEDNLKTVDVKGLSSKGNWLLGNKLPLVKENHFIVLVTYLRKINDLKQVPECYVIPSTEITDLSIQTLKGFIIKYNNDKLKAYRDNWIVF
jgi:hypothetical protein